ncbi:MAG TPA: serine/threonine-protein kinase [Fibrobacteria bacterium]|nr:serine/threonine-protein kinase [Fibrobacteria bacterium]
MSFATGDFSDWSLLGEGGEAQIFRARQVSLDRMVAIKRLKLSSIGDEEEIKRFEREAKLCASLSHPSLVQVNDYGSDGKFYYLVMEYVQGVDLGKMAELGSAYVSSSNLNLTGGQEVPGLPAVPAAGEPAFQGLPESLKVHLALQMVEVVEFIHQKGVLHRDLKPENFMVDPTGRIKLLDLGMARARSQGLSQTDSRGDAIKGTLAYIPPEILRGQGRLENVSEYYSLALVLLEIFSGARYYRGKSADELVALIQSGISTAGMTGVAASVKALLSPYLDPDPARRPRTLEPLLKGLKGMQSNTLTLAGGREALEVVVRREQRAWLWAMVKASEGTGKIEEAFARLRELLEADPDNAEVQAKFQELGVLMNDAPKSASPRPPPRRRSGWSGRAVESPQGMRARGLAVIASVIFITVGFFYFEDRLRIDDLGRDLMEREMNLLSRENQAEAAFAASAPPSAEGRPAAATAAGAQTPSPGIHRPTLLPYGVLIVTGLPKDYRLMVNRVRYPAGGEIHLPASRHLLEVQDAGNRPVLRDTVAIGGGEPTVYDFTRRAGKP